MEAVGNTAGISHAIFYFLAHAQKAREFENEFERHQLRLDILQVRLSRQIQALQMIGDMQNSNDCPYIQDDERICDTLEIAAREERSLADILAAVQHTLLKAQREATKMRTTLAPCASTTSGIHSPSINSSASPCSCAPLGEQPARLRALAFLDKRRAQTTKAINIMQWVVYKRDQFDRSIADIAALVADLERLARD